MSSSTRVAIALGSNLGDRHAHLASAVSALSRVISGIRLSTAIDTEPAEVSDPQPRYLNAALAGDTTLGPHALLDVLQRIEEDHGRERPYLNAPRTLDLDLILYGDLVYSDDRLMVPHQRFRERAFVLTPLAEVAPEMVDPQTGLTVGELLARLTR